MKNFSLPIVVILLLALPACGSAEETKGESLTHIHGLSYSLSQPGDLYISTHHGLLHMSGEREWTWIGEEQERHDFMGFSIINKETMISSGHPAPSSPLQDPLGIIKSNDGGQTWEPVALHGEADFHLLEANSLNHRMYGIDAANSEFFRTDNSGESWEAIQTEGFPEDLHEVNALVSHYLQPEHLLAGTKKGIYKSIDGGKSWKKLHQHKTFSGAVNDRHNSEQVYAYMPGNGLGLMKSKDFGHTWESMDFRLNDDDFVTFIDVHPENPEEISIATSNESIYQTQDGGETWEALVIEGTTQDK
ncbi:F510_1955 family glycosylhydrolase [Thalassobacillus sp. C254]|uniref:F510_1955 family glycosylhydrolase n=1 Tax=Thalassobacillus sp. C254 TaxID=1225341 RepID=UPI0006D0EBFD|nr:YCF48-related protein [Thalassobacillus sp. C254]